MKEGKEREKRRIKGKKRSAGKEDKKRRKGGRKMIEVTWVSLGWDSRKRGVGVSRKTEKSLKKERENGACKYIRSCDIPFLHFKISK